MAGDSPPRRSGTGCWVVRWIRTSGATYGVTITALPLTFTSEAPLPAMLTGQREVAWYANVGGVPLSPQLPVVCRV